MSCEIPSKTAAHHAVVSLRHLFELRGLAGGLLLDLLWTAIEPPRRRLAATRQVPDVSRIQRRRTGLAQGKPQLGEGPRLRR